jgi:hypothetical protein
VPKAECGHCVRERSWRDGVPRADGPVRWLVGVTPACDRHLLTACEAAANEGIEPVVTRLRAERETAESWDSWLQAVGQAASAWESRRRQDGAQPPA